MIKEAKKTWIQAGRLQKVAPKKGKDHHHSRFVDDMILQVAETLEARNPKGFREDDLKDKNIAALSTLIGGPDLKRDEHCRTCMVVKTLA